MKSGGPIKGTVNGRYRIIDNPNSKVYKFAVVDSIRGSRAVIAATRSKAGAIKIAHALQYVQDDMNRMLQEVVALS